MVIPPSAHFAPVALTAAYNLRRGELPDSLRAPVLFADRHDLQTIRGMPFDLGAAGDPNVVLLDREPISIELNGEQATYVLFLHAVEDIETKYLAGFADSNQLPGDRMEGYELGGRVSEYELEYRDGETVSVPILRRFAIQQARYEWGSTPFACVAAASDVVVPTAGENYALGRSAELSGFQGALGQETRCVSADVIHMLPPAFSRPPGADFADHGVLWIYALPNPEPSRPLRQVHCQPRDERSAIYAVSTTTVSSHPLRAGLRSRRRLRLPDSVPVNEIGEVEDVGIDLGTVISARLALDYDHERWIGSDPIVEPTRSQHEVLVEYAAHPQARLYIGDEVHDLGGAAGDSPQVATSERPVSLKFVDGDTGDAVPVRLHMHGVAGEYLPPRGYKRKVEHAWIEHDFPEFVNVENQYAYVDGECVADLPLGTVYVEITRGYEVAPIRTTVVVDADADSLTFTLDRVLNWRERGWVTADTHVHFLSPQTALLEGKAEGINVVNLLASQWGETFSSVGDFDGRTTFGAEDLGGRGEFLVRVGSENRTHVLGHISLLGYEGQLIDPLCTGGPEESAFGDPVEVTMAEWAQRCIDQRGLVVMPHAPMPQLERAADVVLGLVDAIELMCPNPLDPRQGQLNLFGIADWYRYLNLGYHVPLVGGSDRMTSGMLLGGVRTYTYLGRRELTYDGWKEAVRAGNTFATVGPLCALQVEGVAPGGEVKLPQGGGSVEVVWEVESARVPIERVEIVAGGLVVEEVPGDGSLSVRGRAAIPVTQSTWIALRVRGSHHGRPEDVASHTSAVMVTVDGSELFSEVDAGLVLDQIQGTIAYVDTVAPRADARRFRELRATLESAYSQLHQRMHAVGIDHSHPLHSPGEPHEH